MPIGYRRPIIAVCGCLIAASVPLHSPLRADSAKRDGATVQHSGSAHSSKDTVTGHPETNDTKAGQNSRALGQKSVLKEGEEDCKASREHHTNLCLQYDILSEYKTANKTADRTFSLNLIATIMLLLTLAATALAARAAGSAAKASAKSADAFVAVERARLIATVTAAYNGDNMTSLVVAASNIGRSAASIEEVGWRSIVTPIFPPDFEYMSSFVALVPSLQEVTTQIVQISSTPPVDLYIAGYIKYRSAFDLNHRSYFFVSLVSAPETFRDLGTTNIVVGKMTSSMMPKDN